jgi:hypothetical protein
MHYNKEEVESHLNIVSKYIEFIVSLNQKYTHEEPHIKKKFVLRDLIYYTDESLTIRLCKAFNFIVDNFNKTGNFFLCEYFFLRESRKLNTSNICGCSLIHIGRVEDLRHILEIVVRVTNNPEDILGKLYLKMIT